MFKQDQLTAEESKDLWIMAGMNYREKVAQWYTALGYPNGASECPHPWKAFEDLDPYLQWLHMHFETLECYIRNPGPHGRNVRSEVQRYEPKVNGIVNHAKYWSMKTRFFYRYVPDIIWGEWPTSYPLPMRDERTRAAAMLRSYPSNTVLDLAREHGAMIMGVKHHSYQRMHPGPKYQYI